jgi:hypothetical protein
VGVWSMLLSNWGLYDLAGVLKVNPNFGYCVGVIVEDRGQRERGSGGGSHLVGGSTQFANE